MVCDCGSLFEEIEIHIMKKFKQRDIVITSVPALCCSQNHIKLSKETRNNLDLNYDVAFNSGLNVKPYQLIKTNKRKLNGNKKISICI